MVPWYPKVAPQEGYSEPIHRKAVVLLWRKLGRHSLFRTAKLYPMSAVATGKWLPFDYGKRVFRVLKRFLSNATNRIDAKGRVSVPSAFRSVLSERGILELYCFQDFVFPAISIGGLDLLDRFEQQIAAEDPFSAQANQMSLLIHGGGVFMKLDAEGRLMVTDFIRDFTGITDEVTFVGRADHFQLWSPKVFQDLQAAAREERKLAGARSS